MGHRVRAGEEEIVGQCIASTSHTHGRMADGDKRRSGADRGSGGSVVPGGR
jgi:hypothetical protein